MSDSKTAVKQQIKVFSTSMGEKVLESSATTWGELQKELSSSNISHSGMKAVIGESKVTLEATEALLPTTGFTLFLMPIKTKSGVKSAYDGLSYKELRSAIQSILVTAKNDNAKNHFNKDKNYTTKGTEELRDLLKTFKGAKSAPVATPVAVKAKAIIKAPVKVAAKIGKNPMAKVTKVVAKTAPVAKIVKPVVVKTQSFEGLSYKELRANIKTILDNNSAAGSHFNDGKNYTTKGTEELRRLLTTYKGTATVKTETKVAPKAEAKTPAPKATVKATTPVVDTRAEYNRLASQFKDVRN